MVAILKPAFMIRPMTEGDLAGVIDIEQSCYSFPWSVNIFKDCLRVGYRCCVLEADGRVCGYSIVSMIPDECHILNLCIAKAYQSRGLGRSLMQHILDEAVIMEARMAYLEVRPSNMIATELYFSMGFEQIAVRKDYYPSRNGREDALILVKVFN
jgi:ribosomal-protein-alanine N-acetyltransferase